jgi:hypothetical protein
MTTRLPIEEARTAFQKEAATKYLPVSWWNWDGDYHFSVAVSNFLNIKRPGTLSDILSEWPQALKLANAGAQKIAGILNEADGSLNVRIKDAKASMALDKTPMKVKQTGYWVTVNGMITFSDDEWDDLLKKIGAAMRSLGIEDYEG